MINQFLTTLAHRPYVFAFLTAFLFLSWRRWGWRRTILWLISGYAIAWASELSSIHNGFPYGSYKYVHENLAGELLIFGVPFFDSLSYAFLTYAGFSTATFLVGSESLTNEPTNQRTNARVVILAALLTMLLDVIVDPVATMGDKWFLGKIHYYVYPGRYFGVPLTNFGGWFLVSLAIVAFNAFAWHVFPKTFTAKESLPKLSFFDPIFYLSIGLFQTCMAFWIGEPRLGMAGVMILTAISLALIVRHNTPHYKRTS